MQPGNKTLVMTMTQTRIAARTRRTKETPLISSIVPAQRIESTYSAMWNYS